MAMSGKMYMGIDPGAKGFIALQEEDGSKDFLSIADSRAVEIADFLRQRVMGNRVMCCMEDVHALFGAGAGTTFSFGRVNGLLEGFLIAFGIPYVKVPPKEWQSEIWINGDKVYVSKERKSKGEIKQVRAVDTKRTSMNAAVRLFPDVDFRKSPKSKNLDDNKCDAMLICEYGRRRNM